MIEGYLRCKDGAFAQARQQNLDAARRQQIAADEGSLLRQQMMLHPSQTVQRNPFEQFGPFPSSGAARISQGSMSGIEVEALRNLQELKTKDTPAIPPESHEARLKRTLRESEEKLHKQMKANEAKL